MAVELYDEAIVNKLKSWLPETSDIQILKPDETSRFLKMKQDQLKDKPIKLPLIALSRERNIHFANVFKQPKSFDGVRLRKFDKDGFEVKDNSAMKLNAIPMELSYQLDIYTKERTEADNYLREFMFKFVNKPKIKITLPYRGANITHESTIYVDPDAEDTSDVPERVYPYEFTRYTIKFVIDNAYIFSIPEKPNLRVDLGELEVDTIKDGEVKIETIENVDLD